MRRLPLLLLLAVTVAACDSGGPGFVEDGSTVTMAYEGRLADGTVFDSRSSADFVVRQSIPGVQRGLIPGFYNAILGLAVGEQKTFEVTPEQGYGEAGVVTDAGEVIIPPNATLTFDVTVLGIQ